MKYEIILQTSIATSPSSVWQVLTELERYPEWNPFVLRCESSLQPGKAIFMWVKLLPFTLKQRETIRHNDGKSFMEYGVHIPGLLYSTRQHKLETDQPASCLYHSIFRLEGLLAPLIGGLLNKRLKHGFSAMTEALKLRCEESD
ncbi:MAG: SRPBCC domain-containing protein [Pseudomonadales bacterium]|nr:SRPBCC domain-containing protein [Pseudomonadales bacterium]